MVEQTAGSRHTRKTRKGTVIRRSGDKSIVVQIMRRVPHPHFHKVITRFRKLHVHDEKNEAAVGDKVEVMETRPVSRLKHWRLVQVLRHETA